MIEIFFLKEQKGEVTEENTQNKMQLINNITAIYRCISSGQCIYHSRTFAHEHFSWTICLQNTTTILSLIQPPVTEETSTKDNKTEIHIWTKLFVAKIIL